MGIEIGCKVVPVSKKAGHREFDSCATHYLRLENNQKFLYVTGLY